MTTAPTPPQCPRCRTALMPDNVSAHGVVQNAWSCERCKGFWLSFAKLTELEMQERARLFELRFLPKQDEQAAPLDCPQCGRPLEKVANTRDRHVTMDVCDDCQHVWLDHGEMQAIRTESLASLVGQVVHLLRERRKA